MKLISANEAKERASLPMTLQLEKIMNNIESSANSCNFHCNNYHRLSDELQCILKSLGYKLEQFNWAHQEGDFFMISWD